MERADVLSRAINKILEERAAKSKMSDLSPNHKHTSLAVAKSKDDLRKIEEVEDCFILEFDPFETIDFSKLSLTKKSASIPDEVEISILAEKGQVACKDYPHPRHLCAVYPFDKSPHEQHCSNCYCLICDVPAPCRQWNAMTSPIDLLLTLQWHCDASNDSGHKPARVVL